MGKNDARALLGEPILQSSPATVGLEQARLAQQAHVAQGLAVAPTAPRNVLETGAPAARDLALAAAELCKGTMQPQTLVQARRLLKLALVHLDA